MDTLIKRDSPETDILGELRNYQIIVGAKQLKKALIRGDAHSVYLAEDADPAITAPLETLCEQHRVAYHWIGKMADLGSACGIDVGAAAAAAVKSK